MSAPHRLKKVRVEFRTKEGKKLSGIAVAKMLGITPQYYYDIEKGERNLSSELASKLADIFHTTTDYLLGKTDINIYNWVGHMDNDDLGEQIKESPTPYIYEKELFDNSLELSDNEIHEQFDFKVDGRSLTEEEYQRMIAAVRAERLYRDQQNRK